MHDHNTNEVLIEGARREWQRPELRRLEAGAAEANAAISGRTDNVGQQES